MEFEENQGKPGLHWLPPPPVTCVDTVTMHRVFLPSSLRSSLDPHPQHTPPAVVTWVVDALRGMVCGLFLLSSEYITHFSM